MVIQRDIWWGNQREIGRKIGKVFWLGEPRGIGGTNGKREREMKREKEREREKGKGKRGHARGNQWERNS